LAVQYLWTANRTADEGARQLLRRRAAELILPRFVLVGRLWTGRASVVR